MDRRSLAALVLLVLAGLAGTVRAQSLPGDFQPFNSWWIHPTQGTLGVNAAGAEIQLDRDGDGIAESTLDMPPGLPIAARTNLRLSPSRQILYAFGGVCNTAQTVVAGTFVYFYDVPPSGRTLQPIREGLCIPNGILQPPRFYDTGLCDPTGVGLDCFPGSVPALGLSPQRIAYFVTQSTGLAVWIIWVDLNTGASSAPAAFDYQSNLGFIQVSPGGTQAFVQHDLGLPGETDYTLVDLCPGNVGTPINMGGFPLLNQQGSRTAEVSDVSGGTVTVLIGDGGAGVITSFDLVDCLAPEPTGPCCESNFTCTPLAQESVCEAGGGTWLGEGALCSACPPPPAAEACCFDTIPVCLDRIPATCLAEGGTPVGTGQFCFQSQCPVPDPVVSKVGAVSASPGEEITYTLSYANEGDLVLRNAVLSDELPGGTTFVSATGNGDLVGGFSVTWDVGDVPPGGGGQRSFTVEVGCGVSTVNNFNFSYRFGGDIGGLVGGQNSVATTINAGGDDPVLVSVSATPARDPLQGGDLVTVEIQLTNPSARQREGIQLATGTIPGIEYGRGMTLESVIDAAGGVVDTSFESRIGWTGSLPPLGSRTIRFALALVECVPGDLGETRLNFGEDVAVLDLCDQAVGSAAAPDAIAIAHPVEASLLALELRPPTEIVTPISTYDAQLLRTGTRVTLQMELRSGTGQAVDGVEVLLPTFGLALDPAPLVQPTDPGASYTGFSIEWAGDVPASGSIPVTFEAELVDCRADLDVSGSSDPASGCQDIGQRTVLAAVPDPGDGYLGILGPGTGFEDRVLRFRGGDVEPSVDLCLPTEFVNGMGSGPASVWVGWLPIFHYDPATLALSSFPYTRLAASGLTSTEDIAVHPGNGVAYFVGSGLADDGGFSSSFAAIRRVQPGSLAVSSVLDDPTYDRFSRAVVDADGRIAAVANPQAGPAALVQVDPSAPPSARGAALRTYEVTGVSSPGNVAVDVDGDYIVVDGGFQPPWGLVEVEPVSGDSTTVVADLATMFPSVAQSFGRFTSVTVAPNGDIYLAASIAGLAVVHREPAIQGEELIPFSFATGPTDIGYVPEPGTLALALAALAALAVVRRGRGWLGR